VDKHVEPLTLELAEAEPLSHCGKMSREASRSELTSKAAEVLEKAMELSNEERGMIIHRLAESLDDGSPEEGVEAAWGDEIKRRVEEIRSGKVKMVPGEEMRRWFNDQRRDAKK